MPLKVAVASEDGNSIARHFGRTPYFAVFTIENDEIVEKELRSNTFTPHTQNSQKGGQHNHAEGGGHGGGHRCGSQVIDGLSDCQAVICGGAGMRIVDALKNANIQMIITHYNGVEDSIKAYLAGGLQSSMEPCQGHDH